MMRQKTARATIKAVAAAAGVSTQTVSRVVNERPDVSPETRKRVQAAIHDLSYRPSALARSLSSQRSYTLGVVTAGLKYIGPSRTLSGIAAAAEEAGYALLLKELPSFVSSNVTPIFQTLLSHHVDGIIWAVPEIGDNHTWVNSSPTDLAVPIVYLTMAPQNNITVVSIDNYRGGRLAMAHLLEQGYQHIGHIAGPLEWWEARQRLAAWQDALHETGRVASATHMAEGNWSSASGAVAIEKLFAQYPELDAVFVANDQMALGVLHFLSAKGLSIPAAIGLVGFDNLAEAAYFSPALTTIQQAQEAMAKLAVAEIIKIIEADELAPPTSIVLGPTLVVRQSSNRLKEGGDASRP